MTANQRGASIAAGREWLPVLPIPDGTIDTSDRAQLGWSYFFEAAVPTTFVMADDVYQYPAVQRVFQPDEVQRVYQPPAVQRIYQPEDE